MCVATVFAVGVVAGLVAWIVCVEDVSNTILFSVA